MANTSRGGRLSGQLFPTALGVVGTGTLLLWVLAAWGALKPTALHIGDIHHHHHAPVVSDRPAGEIPQAPRPVDPQSIVIHTPPPQIFVHAGGDPKRTGQAVQAELEARQEMVQAARRELAGELTQDDLVRSYHRGVQRIYGDQSQRPTGVAKVTRALGSPSDGLWWSDCEGREELMPLSEKFPARVYRPRFKDGVL